MSRKEVIQVISDIGQENRFFSSREPLGFTYSVKAAAKYEEA